MRRILLAGLVILSGTAVSWADSLGAGKMELSLGGGIVVPISAVLTDPGPGGELFLGYRFSDLFSVGLQGALYSMPPRSYPAGSPFISNGSTTQFEIAPEIKAHINVSDSFGFLALAAGGLSFYSDNSNNTGRNPAQVNISETDPLVEAGIGIEIGLGKSAGLYLIDKVDAVFSSSARGGSDVYTPIEAGLDFSL